MTTKSLPTAVFCSPDKMVSTKGAYPTSVRVGLLEFTEQAPATFSTPKMPAQKPSTKPAVAEPPTELQVSLSPNMAKFVMAQRAGKEKAGDLRTPGQVAIPGELQAALSPALAKFVSAQRAAKAKR